jgi:hypothetical protein
MNISNGWNTKASETFLNFSKLSNPIPEKISTGTVCFFKDPLNTKGI